MSRDTSALIYDCFKQLYPKKAWITIGTVGILTLLLGGNWYLWRKTYYEILPDRFKINTKITRIYRHQHPHPPKHERCSSEYTEYSVITDYPVTTVDGSIQVEDGTVYPPAAVWEGDGLVRVCPCTISQCLHSCCRQDQLVDNSNQYTLRCVENNNPGSNISLFKLTLPHLPNKYKVLYGDCGTAESDPYSKLTKDGRILNNYEERHIDQFRHCFNVLHGKVDVSLVYICSRPRIVHPVPHKVKWLRKALEFTFILVSAGLLLVSMTVFALVPKLRTGYGTTLMAYQAGQLLNKTAKTLYLFDFTHIIIEVLEYYGDVFSRICQVFVAYQSWTGLRPCQFSRQNARSSYTFIACSAILSTLVTTTLWGGKILEWKTNPRYEIEDQVGLITVYLHPLLKQLKTTIPLLTIELVSMAFCAATLCRLRASKINLHRLQGSESSRHNARQIHWSDLFLKLSLVTGVDYTLITAHTVVQRIVLLEFNTFIPFYIQYIFRDLNNFRGSEVFFVFVLKKEIWDSLKERCFPKRVSESSK